jgi:hypothetical protein
VKQAGSSPESAIVPHALGFTAFEIKPDGSLLALRSELFQQHCDLVLRRC